MVCVMARTKEMPDTSDFVSAVFTDTDAGAPQRAACASASAAS